MAEIITALNNIAAAQSNGGLPHWLSTAGVIAPILLTCITIILSIQMNRQNKKLQKQIHNRDAFNQMRQMILDIYRSFLCAYDVTQMPGPFVASVYVSDQSYHKWALAVETSSKELMLSFNTAKLLLNDDEESIDYLRKCWTAFADIDSTINTYNTSGIAAKTIMAAWKTFEQRYGIQYADYSALLINPELGEEFKKMCDNSYTQEIQRKIETYRELLINDKFDDVFRRHIQLQELS